MEARSRRLWHAPGVRRRGHGHPAHTGFRHGYGLRTRPAIFPRNPPWVFPSPGPRPERSGRCPQRRGPRRHRHLAPDECVRGGVSIESMVSRPAQYRRPRFRVGRHHPRLRRGGQHPVRVPAGSQKAGSSQEIRSATMRHFKSILILAVLGMSTGCVKIASVHPLFSDTAREVVFDPVLLGKWQGGDTDKSIFEVTRLDKTGYAVAFEMDGKPLKATFHLLKSRGLSLLDAIYTDT